jgi:hypothetical protein
MALITGGNLLVAVSATILIMIVVVLVMIVSVFNLDNFLSISLSDLVNQEQVATVQEDAPALSSDEARQMLGFVDYPVVNIQADAVSIFSKEAIIDAIRLSAEEITERCAFITIPFNHDRCIRAEQGCDAVLESENDHRACLEGYRFYIGKKL